MATITLGNRKKRDAMCGWCFESFVKEVLEKERSNCILPEDCDEDWTAWFYLREGNDFPLALERLSQSMKRKKVVPLEYLSAEIVLLRMLEILLQHGFSSPIYQRLIRRRLIRSLIVKACDKCRHSAFVNALKDLNLGPLAMLNKSDTYLSQKMARQLTQPAAVIPACRSLLNFYRTWWLQGKGLARNDLSMRMEETGILDPIEDVAEADQERFELLFRTIFFSILMVGEFAAGKNMLHILAKEDPAGVPLFTGNDLWLQRTAALKLYDLIGFDAFCGYFADFRDTLFYYIDLKRGLTLEQKTRLLELARRKPVGKRDDNFFSVEEWVGELI